MSPPITTACGVEQVDRDRQHLAELRGRSRAAAPRAVGVALERQRDQVADVARPSCPASPARATSAQPPASVSRQPVVAAAAGQARGGVDLGVADLAGRAEVAAETTRPSAMMPRPEAGGGLDDQQVVEWPRVRPAARSGRARRRRSPTKSGACGRPRRGTAPSSTPSQPDMTGESMLTPRTGSRVPGRLSPTRAPAVAATARRAGRASRSAIRASARRGRRPTSWSTRVGGELLAARSNDRDLAARAADRRPPARRRRAG